jgi:hypothetical protein
MAIKSREIDGVDEAGQARAVPRTAGGGGGRARAARPGASLWSLGVVAIILGGVLWLIGARYTLEGWVYALNLGLEFTRLPARVPSPAGWWWLLALPLGIIYSVAEVMIPFGVPRSWHHAPQWVLMLIALGVVHGSDVGSTFLGYMVPSPSPWPLHAWAVAAIWPSFVWAALLTYIPERLILSGIGWIRHSIRG